MTDLFKYWGKDSRFFFNREFICLDYQLCTLRPWFLQGLSAPHCDSGFSARQMTSNGIKFWTLIIISLIFSHLLIKMSTALYMVIHFPGSGVKNPKQKLFMKPAGNIWTEKWVKIFQVLRNRKSDPSKESIEIMIKIHSLNWLKKYCCRGTWVFLSVKFPLPGFQLSSWSQGHQIHPYSAWSLLSILSSFPSAPLLLALPLLLSLQKKRGGRIRRTIIQFCSGCHSEDKYTKPYPLYFMCENLNLHGHLFIPKIVKWHSDL